MPSGSDRLLRQLTADRDAAFPELPSAVVTAVAAGAGSDGGDVVTVAYRGGTYAFPHIGATPAVDQTVVLIRWAGNWLILGRPVGFAP